MNGIRILVIDDDPAIINTIKAFLSDKYYIDGVMSSLEGIEKIKNEFYDILILDHRIDEHDGIWVVNEIRKFNKDIYILLLTGYGNEAPGLKTLDTLDIQSYCEKGGNIDNIIITIESAIKSVEFCQNKKISTGSRIRYLRKLYNLSQDDVAKRLNLNRTTITSYEVGDKTPPSDIIYKLAELFNVTTDYLLGYELKPKKTFDL